MKQKLTINLEDGRSYEINKIELIEKDGKEAMIVRISSPMSTGDHITFDQSEVAGIVYNVEE